MRLKFNSLIRLPLVITKLNYGYIETNSWEPVLFFRRKIGSIADFVYFGSSTIGRLEHELVEPWYEYTASFTGSTLCTPVSLLPYGYKKIETGKINLAGSKLLNKVPLNVYKKDATSSNTYGIMNAFGASLDDNKCSIETLKQLKSFGSLNPFLPDCEFKFFSTSDQIEYKNTRLKRISSIDDLVPSSYSKAGQRKQLHFGFDSNNFFHVKTPYRYTDECNKTHSVIFFFDTTNKLLDLLTEDSYDCIGTYTLFDYNNNHIIDIRGIDFVDNYLYILTDSHLHRFYMPTYTIEVLQATCSIPVNLDSTCYGLKMGSSFFSTTSSDFIVYTANYNSFMETDGLYTTYGDVQSIIEMCSPDILIKPSAKINVATVLDKQLAMFGLKRTTAVRAGEFLLTVSCVNMNMLNRTNDPVDVLLKESEMYYIRYKIQDLGRGIDEITLTRDGVINLIDKYYSDNLSTLKWGQVIL